MKYIGIDISKQTFDVCFLDENGKDSHSVFSNNKQGFRQFSVKVKENDHCVMEASGPYYLGLATFLHTAKKSISVVNPLVIRRYSQMKLTRAKTDAKDAYLIASYGANQKPDFWNPDTEVISRLRQLYSVQESFLKQLNMAENQLEALDHIPLTDKCAKKALKDNQKFLVKQLQKIDQQIGSLATQEFGDQLKRITSIPGIGNKTAIWLIVITNNFEKFDSAKKLVAYAGLAPRIFQSGTSVNGKGKICKLGGGKIRASLYMCALTASRFNPFCKALYLRLINAGKPKIVALIAVAHKLLRQAFGVGKFKRNFDPNYLVS